METQNNPAKDGADLIDQLISNQSTQKSDAPVAQDTDGQVLITTARVVSIRYKIYVLVLLAIVGYFVYDYVVPAYYDYLDTASKLTTITTEIDNFPTKKMRYEADRKLVTTITQQQDQIISCLNYKVGCAQLDKAVQDNFGVARSYIQLNTLSTPKMAVDERKILANINEYLIKKISNDPAVVSRSKNGTINSIAIGEAKA
jgi:hypothetical protein